MDINNRKKIFITDFVKKKNFAKLFYLLFPNIFAYNVINCFELNINILISNSNYPI